MSELPVVHPEPKSVSRESCDGTFQKHWGWIGRLGPASLLAFSGPAADRAANIPVVISIPPPG